MDDRMIIHVETLINRYPCLEATKSSIINAYLLMEECYFHDRKLLVAGNGGSAADAEHIVGELMKRFRLSRPIGKEMQLRLEEIDPVRGKSLVQNLGRSLTAIALVAHEALTTAYINDADGKGVFAQQLLGYGRAGDVFLGISTSGNSENIIHASIVAKAMGIKVIGLTGNNGGKLKEFADVIVCVPEIETYKIQELHLPIYHCWCMMLEEKFFG